MQLAEGLRVAGPCGWSSLATTAIIIALAASLRTAAAWHDLWLDEIWSLLMVDRFVSFPVDLLRWAAIACGLAVAGLGGGCLVQCWRDRPARGWFFLLSIVGAPATVLGLFPAEHLAIRYLIVPLQTLLLLIAEEVPVFVVTQRAACRPWAAAIAVGAANALRDGVLISRGRGAYRDFLKAVAAESHWPGATITAASDSHFRNTLLISYHKENVEGRGIRVFDEAALPKWGSEWYFLLDTRDGMPPRPQVTDRHGNRYTFAGETRGGGLSASHWQVYRNQNGPWPAEEQPR